jgi:hypothetical protein
MDMAYYNTTLIMIKNNKKQIGNASKTRRLWRIRSLLSVYGSTALLSLGHFFSFLIYTQYLHYYYS